MIDWNNNKSDRCRADEYVRAAKSGINPGAVPAIHFHPPAGWMNDPNGPLFAEGRFHLFYQHNPYSDSWGDIHWGHACSEDLIHWHHLPIALAPNKNAGLEHCFSGTCIRRADGRYLILFTAISQDHGLGVRRGAEQWGALADQDLIEWTPTRTPVLTEREHVKAVYEWRDPFCFRHAGRVFLILGGNESDPAHETRGSPCVFLYEAQDETLDRWEYKGVLFRHPNSQLRSVECPAFFPLGDRWVLIVSPYGPVEWYTGVFYPDDASGEFLAIESAGRIDGLRHHYASTIVGGDIDKPILLGWVGGFPEGLGWNGVLALPRQLTLCDGRLFQSLGIDLGNIVRRTQVVPREGAIAGNVFRLRMITAEPDNVIVFPIESHDHAIVETLTIGPGFTSMSGQRIAFEMPNATVVEAVVDRRMTEVFTDTGECVTFVHTQLPPQVRIKCLGSRKVSCIAEIDDLRSLNDDSE